MNDLRIFDLDETLLKGDSDYLWGQFLRDNNFVDSNHEEKNNIFAEDYKNGTLDIKKYLAFSLEPLTRFSISELNFMRAEFCEAYIKPIVYQEGVELLNDCYAKGDDVLLISATNNFVVTEIAKKFFKMKEENILATKVEIVDGKYTGNFIGDITFREGKIVVLKSWLANQDKQYKTKYFYSDSINDLSLLEYADVPIATNPDASLLKIAQARNWAILNFKI